jgi:hypothetical protein
MAAHPFQQDDVSRRRLLRGRVAPPVADKNSRSDTHVPRLFLSRALATSSTFRRSCLSHDVLIPNANAARLIQAKVPATAISAAQICSETTPLRAVPLTRLSHLGERPNQN